MSIRNLEFLLRPRSAALIGASRDTASVGAVLPRNLFHGGFDGPVMPVNPRHAHIQSVTTYPDIEALPTVPDLAVVAIPPESVPGLIAEIQAARFTQINYDRGMALVLTEPGVPGRTQIFGVVRISADPDNEWAEYAIIVHHDLTGRALGRRLMHRIIDYARQRGSGEIFGHVLRENAAMLGLCRSLGFAQRAKPDEPDLVEMRLRL